MKKLATSIAALGLLAGGSVASACTLSAWSSTSGTAPEVGGPGDTVELARYSGICSMQSDGAEFVQDNSPAAEGALIARFYFLASGTGDATIYEAFSDEGGATSVFAISADGANVTVTPASGTAASAPMRAGWNSVEVSWTGGGGISLWVNSDSTTAAADATGTDTGSATIDAIQLGTVDGLGGFTSVNFDQYESRRTTAIGREIPGDATGDGGALNIFDAIGIIQEVVNGTAQVGQPDCTEDGAINIFDAICVIQAVVNG